LFGRPQHHLADTLVPMSSHRFYQAADVGTGIYFNTGLSSNITSAIAFIPQAREAAFISKN